MGHQPRIASSVRQQSTHPSLAEEPRSPVHEASRLHVTRSDIAPAFVEMMRQLGRSAQLLDVRSDVLAAHGWTVTDLDHWSGHQDWLHVLARAR